MKELSSKRGYLKLLIAPAPIAGSVLIALMETDIPVLYTGVIMATIIFPSWVYWFTKGRRPAAIIKDDVLIIRGGPFNDITIPKSKIEHMSYIADKNIKIRHGEIMKDELKVKMDGYSEWEIPITDVVDHIDGKRLYGFINENFYQLPYERSQANK